LCYISLSLQTYREYAGRAEASPPCGQAIAEDKTEQRNDQSIVKGMPKIASGPYRKIARGALRQAARRGNFPGLEGLLKSDGPYSSLCQTA